MPLESGFNNNNELIELMVIKPKETSKLLKSNEKILIVVAF